VRSTRLLLGSTIAAGAPFVRRWQLSWGAAREEATGTLPGDGILGGADLIATRAVTIDAAADRVWPWIAQLGQGRGGFYSYDWLENLFGCDIHSADRVVPQWQRVAVGDEVKLHPEMSLTVASVEPGRSLILRGGVPMGSTPPPYDFTWAFVLRDAPGGGTRLIVRERYRYEHWWALLIVEPVSMVSFLMSRRMLRGIRCRSQRDAHAG
jgi:Polyketide cyclase / dehydrase and lipid transport.